MLRGVVRLAVLQPCRPPRRRWRGPPTARRRGPRIRPRRRSTPAGSTEVVPARPRPHVPKDSKTDSRRASACLSTRAAVRVPGQPFIRRSAPSKSPSASPPRRAASVATRPSRNSVARQRSMHVRAMVVTAQPADYGDVLVVHRGHQEPHALPRSTGCDRLSLPSTGSEGGPAAEGARGRATRLRWRDSRPQTGRRPALPPGPRAPVHRMQWARARPGGGGRTPGRARPTAMPSASLRRRAQPATRRHRSSRPGGAADRASAQAGGTRTTSFELIPTRRASPVEEPYVHRTKYANRTVEQLSDW